MGLPLFLRTIEDSSLALWVRESPSILAFPTILAIHTFGMALFAGLGTIVSLRLLGVAARMPLAPLGRVYGPIWLGLWLNIVTGVLLVVGYPTKQLTNPIFYVKIVLVGIAAFTLYRIRGKAFSGAGLSDADVIPQTRRLAVFSLALFVGVISAGRMLAYFYWHLFYPI